MADNPTKSPTTRSRRQGQDEAAEAERVPAAPARGHRADARPPGLRAARRHRRDRRRAGDPRRHARRDEGQRGGHAGAAGAADPRPRRHLAAGRGGAALPRVRARGLRAGVHAVRGGGPRRASRRGSATGWCTCGCPRPVPPSRSGSRCGRIERTAPRARLVAAVTDHLASVSNSCPCCRPGSAKCLIPRPWLRERGRLAVTESERTRGRLGQRTTGWAGHDRGLRLVTAEHQRSA